ncbi:MAG: TlpA disulfide reductase family protein [Planctomycetota bacterium]
MASRLTVRRAIAFTTCILAAPLCVAQPVADETVEQAWAEFESVWQSLRADEATWDDLRAAYDASIETLPFERLSAEQLSGLSRMTFQFGNGMERSLARLHAIIESDPDDLHGNLKLADLLFWAGPLGYDKPVDDSRERITALIDRVLSHPDLIRTIEDGSAGMLPTLLMAYGTEPEGLDARRRAIEQLVGLIEASDSADGSVAVEIGARWSDVKKTVLSEDQLVAIRATLLPRIQAALHEAEAEPSPDVDTLNLISSATSAIGMMTSAAATRDLVGSAAPDLSIAWSSDDSISSLADLRGRVVLLEFWVTGCGHCIAALSTMRALAERYEGGDVVIVGVTSLQGRHFEPGTDGPADSRDDPALEYELMERFIASQDVTWPVVFTEESAWNPAYEVRGTPHMTLIDPEGNIAANDLHPRLGVEANSSRIDAVLEAFELPRPKPEK